MILFLLISSFYCYSIYILDYNYSKSFGFKWINCNKLFICSLIMNELKSLYLFSFFIKLLFDLTFIFKMNSKLSQIQYESNSIYTYLFLYYYSWNEYSYMNHNIYSIFILVIDLFLLTYIISLFEFQFKWIHSLISYSMNIISFDIQNNMNIHEILIHWSLNDFISINHQIISDIHSNEYKFTFCYT